MTETTTDGPEYTGVAMQVSVKGVNRCTDRASARARINENLRRIGEYTTTAAGFLKFFYGVPVRLVALPEYAVTGFPMKESPAEWRDRACLEQNGPEYEELGRIAQKNDLFLSGNVYEIDPAFPELYFQTCFIIGPNGNVILRYRRLTSCFEPTPHDVWDKYLDVYGPESIFPVARTEIGNLAMMPCGEILWPETARCLTLRGAEVILHPTSDHGRTEFMAWESAKRTRAAENMVYLVSANAGGIEGGPPSGQNTGHSKIFDFQGRVLADTKSAGESTRAFAVIDVEMLRRARCTPGGLFGVNRLARLRVEAYAPVYAAASFYPPNLWADGPMKSKGQIQEELVRVIERKVEAGTFMKPAD